MKHSFCFKIRFFKSQTQDILEGGGIPMFRSALQTALVNILRRMLFYKNTLKKQTIFLIAKP